MSNHPNDAGTHHCPGCGTPGVPDRELTCRADWRRLPRALQRRVYATARLSPTEPRRAEVLAAVIQFFRAPVPPHGRAAAPDPGPGHPRGEVREDEP